MPKKLSNALTPLTVKNAKPGRYADGGGLQLLVKESGARSWVYRFMLSGKSRDIGLGPASGADMVSLADAREKATDLRRLVKAGVDPLAQRTQQLAEVAAAKLAASIAGITFKAVAETYIETNEASWRNDKHRQQWRNTLTGYAYPVMGDLPVADVDTAHVLQILEPIWQTKPATASRIRGRIETVLDAAKARGYRAGENPARWRGHLSHIIPKLGKLSRGHHPSLDYAELPTFMAGLREREALAARALEFVILTNARTGEVIGATWDEIDTAKAVWTIPADRMKAGKEHTIPLSPRALAILEAVKPLNTKGRKDAPLFPTSKGAPLSGMAMAMLVRRMHEADQAAGRDGWIDRREGSRMITVHGFRATFRNWAGEQSSFPREVIEHAMAHQLPDKAEAAYARNTLMPKRTKLMAAWAGYCEAPAANTENVTPIGAAKQSA